MRSGVAIAIGFMAAFALSWPRLVEIWHHGQFYDTDDAMRIVQVRSWLEGQGWYDLVVHRLHPPGGLLMHWSRVVDVPLGLLIRGFELFTTVDRAEILARIVFPVALQLALVAICVHLGRLLAGAGSPIVTAILLVSSGFMFEQFPPGRIDHHAPQITLLVAMTATLLGSLDAGKAWKAGLASLCLAMSLAISLENLPFMVVLIAVLPLIWIADPKLARAPLLWFAFGLAVAVPLAFVATVPPSRYFDPVQDALSIIHVTGVTIGASGFVLLAMLGVRCRTWISRALLLALVGGATLGIVLGLYPQALHDPYAGMDPLVQRLWLSTVTEAQPLLKASALRPDTFTMLFCPLLAGAIALAAALVCETGIARIRWAAMLALAVVGIAGEMWEIRVSASTQPLAVMGGVWALTRLLAWVDRRGSSWLATAAVALALPFSTLGWALVPVGEGDTAAAASLQQGSACRDPSAVGALAALPAGLVFAPIDDGSHLLVHTSHSVVAAPYHRNQVGNKAVLEGFLASPDQAEAVVRGTGARYLALCPGEAQISVMIHAAANGLGAQLVVGHVPGWLEPVPLADTPYRVFRIR